MEFLLICPNDGQVDVGLEDITAVAFRDSETVEVAFVCPRCGAVLRAALQVPNMLRAAMELSHFAENDDLVGETGDARAYDTTAAAEQARAERARIEESYCEYFRRQLAHVECVDDLLAEIDCR